MLMLLFYSKVHQTASLYDIGNDGQLAERLLYFSDTCSTNISAKIIIESPIVVRSVRRTEEQ